MLHLAIQNVKEAFIRFTIRQGEKPLMDMTENFLQEVTNNPDTRITLKNKTLRVRKFTLAEQTFYTTEIEH